MFKLTRYIIPIVVMLLLCFFLWRGLFAKPHEIPSPLLNHPAPDFAIASLTNPNQLITQKDLLDHTTVLNVFASWCQACRTDHPYLEALAKKSDVQVIGLNYKDTREQANTWLTQFGNPFHRIGFDEQGKVAIDWGVYGTPETFIIDKYGIVRYKHIGALDAFTMQNEIIPLLQQLKEHSHV